MKDDPKKLHRGLKDISHLFEDRSTKINDDFHGDRKSSPQKCLEVFEPSSEVKLNLSRNRNLSAAKANLIAAALFYPGCQETQGKLSESLAIKIQSIGFPAGVMRVSWKSSSAENVFSSLPESLPSAVLGIGELDALLREPCRDFEGPSQMALVLDFDSSKSVCFDRIFPLLDHCIVVLRPNLESLTEGYRIIKMASRISPGLEYFVAFEDSKIDFKRTVLFEQFSEFVFRRLGIDIAWLGTMRKGAGPEGLQIFLESLLKRGASDSLEKRLLSRYFSIKPKVCF